MKNKFKVFLSCLLALMLFSSAASLTAGAADYDTANATGFVFSDSGITVTEGSYTGYKVKGTALSVTDAGTYVVSGTCSGGTIVVKKNVTGVTLVLDGLNLSASATAPITFNKGSQATLIAKDGTVSTLADDKYNNDDIYTDIELYPDIENAVIKCKDGSNVTICGSGTINVNSYGKNGIKGGYDLYEEDDDGNVTDTLLSTASLTIKEVTLNVNAAVNDGIKSDKELNILSGNITVSAADDAVKCDYVLNIGAKGTEGPAIKVTKANEGIEAAVVNVYSGNVTVNATDDGINAANSDLTNYNFGYNQYGGYVCINCTNGDGLDSNGTLLLKGGTLEVYGPSSGDGEPLDAESTVTFAGATVLAVGQNQMNQPLVSDGAAYVTFGASASGRPGGIFSGGNTSVVTAGNTISIKDSSGNTLYSGKAVRNASYVIFSSPALVNGSSYTLYNGSSSSSTSYAANSTSGNNPGGNGPGGNRPGEGYSGQQPGEGEDAGTDDSGIGSVLNTILNFFRSVWAWIVSFVAKIIALF
ncbi:MAG: carbohydrate-binding domain-containing protein [Clostridia bacterium]|nr:carbohydrate-binding domain-containing protein [Clostridia bacterium]